MSKYDGKIFCVLINDEVDLASCNPRGAQPCKFYDPLTGKCTAKITDRGSRRRNDFLKYLLRHRTKGGSGRHSIRNAMPSGNEIYHSDDEQRDNSSREYYEQSLSMQPMEPAMTDYDSQLALDDEVSSQQEFIEQNDMLSQGYEQGAIVDDADALTFPDSMTPTNNIATPFPSEGNTLMEKLGPYNFPDPTASMLEYSVGITTSLPEDPYFNVDALMDDTLFYDNIQNHILGGFF